MITQLYAHEETANGHLQYRDGLPAARYNVIFFYPIMINIALSNNFKHSHVHFTQYFQYQS